MSATVPSQYRLRARGAATNDAGRYEGVSREVVDDGWDIPEEVAALRTAVTLERPRSALSWNRSPDLPFDRSVNPYRGCEHGCSYCFARPTHAWLGLSPGLDFETRLVARPGIAAVLAHEIGRKGYSVAPIAIGTNTDPYQPLEARHRVMRSVLEVLADHRHPVVITTKGTLVERDIDLLAPMAAQGLAAVGISVTTLNPDLSRRLEPRAALPARRLEVIRRLAGAGIPVRLMLAPVIPGLTDHEVEAIVAAAAQAGAVRARYIVLRLPLEVAPLFRDWLDRHEPGRSAHVMNRVREMQGGRDYDADFGTRMQGQGFWADLLRQRFARAVRAAGLDAPQEPLRCDLFRRPPRKGDQLDLFGD